VPENPYGIGRFSSGQDRPGPPRKIRIPLGQNSYFIRVCATLSGSVQRTCNSRVSFFVRLTSVQRRATEPRADPTSLPKASAASASRSE
jgi:hypothetical protein